MPRSRSFPPREPDSPLSLRRPYPRMNPLRRVTSRTNDDQGTVGAAEFAALTAPRRTSLHTPSPSAQGTEAREPAEALDHVSPPDAWEPVEGPLPVDHTEHTEHTPPEHIESTPHTERTPPTERSQHTEPAARTAPTAPSEAAERTEHPTSEESPVRDSPKPRASRSLSSRGATNAVAVADRKSAKVSDKLRKRADKAASAPKLAPATGSSTDSPAVALSPGERVEAACLALVGPQIRRMLLTVMPIALATVIALWSTTDRGPLMLWIGLMAVAAVVLAFVSRFEPQLDIPAAIRGRRNEIAAACGFFGMCWALGVCMTYGGVIDTQHRLLLLVATAGVLGAMTLATQLSKHAALALVIPAGLGVAGRFLAGTSFERAVAIVALALAVVHVLHYLDASATQTTLVRNRLENDLLSRKLQKSTEMRLLAEGELARLTQDISSDTERDDITGVKNRAAFREALGDLWQQADAGFDPFSLVLLDIDQYDQIADQHGQEVANNLLRQVAMMIDHALRTDDMVARLGNSQFGLLLNNALTDGALICMERIRRKVSTTPFDAGEPLVVSISTAVVTWERGVGLRQLFAAADTTLQDAMSTGTNQLKVWSNPNPLHIRIPTSVEI